MKGRRRRQPVNAPDARLGDYIDPWEASPSLHFEIFWGDTYLEEYMNMSGFNDIFGGAGKTDLTTAVEDQAFQQNFPTLYLLMAHLVDDAGKKRTPCTLTIVCEQGMVKAGLRERDRGLSLWVSSESLGGVFTALEEALIQRPPQWRKIPDRFAPKR